MSLPPGFLDELRTRTSLAQVAGRKVVWDMRKSNQGKGDWWAPCPFHEEKTASFHVDDRKGFYYCFGCHAKGDAISFVRETENVDFMEAVEILAREAGMTMPARDPEARQKADRRTGLAAAMEDAVRHYRLQLGTGSAAEARAYLERRGLGAAARDRWEIGWAPDARQGVLAHLTGKGIPADLVVAAGLAARPEDGGAPFDRFRGRIIFPIRDARGRCIALGGRSLDPNARAKYLNSPETELFDKSRTLFNHGPAREAAGKGQSLIVAEGYMDVIALSEAGFGAAVAPLGTAITEEQLRMLWRIAPEPVVALDGDQAGLRAAMRLIDLALPLIEAGQSLRFSLMPAGKDPDDVIREDGAGAMQALIDAALPMVELLWRRETEGRVFDSPERRAALDRALRMAVERIRDPSLRRHYAEALNARRWELFRPARPSRRRGADPRAPGGPTPAARHSALAAPGRAVEEELREAVVLALLLAHPGLLPRFEAALETLACARAEHDRIRAALLGAPEGADPPALHERARAAVGADALEKLLGSGHLRIVPGLRPGDGAQDAEKSLEEALTKLRTLRGWEAELAEAAADIAGVADEHLTWRLEKAGEERNRALQGLAEDDTDYVRLDNGMLVERTELERSRANLAAIDFRRRGGGKRS